MDQQIHYEWWLPVQPPSYKMNCDECSRRSHLSAARAAARRQEDAAETEWRRGTAESGPERPPETVLWTGTGETNRYPRQTNGR